MTASIVDTPAKPDRDDARTLASTSRPWRSIDMPDFRAALALRVVLTSIAFCFQQAAHAGSFETGFRLLRPGMSADEVRRLAGINVPKFCKNNNLVVISRKSHRYAVELNATGDVVSVSETYELQAKKITENLFERTIKIANCHPGRFERIEKSQATLVQRGNATIVGTRERSWSAIWNDPVSVSASLSEDLTASGNVLYACSKSDWRLRTGLMIAPCPPQYPFCKVQWFNGGTRF